MALGRARAVALVGVTGHLVEVEADIAAGLPAFTLVGLPDASLAEARDRVRAAAANIGCPLPARRITVNLSPAGLPKTGTGFDLAVAVALLAGAEVLPQEAVAGCVHLGELGLDGRVRRVHAQAVPGDETPIFGGEDIQFVLEVPGGTAARLGIGPGAELRHPTVERRFAAWTCD